MRSFLKYYSLPIVSGFLIGTSYIPFPPWALFFAMIPLWHFWSKEDSFKKIFISGWLTQFILNAIGFHWIAYTTVEFGRLPWPVGGLVLVLFCALAHLYYPIAGVLWKWLVKRFDLSQKISILLIPFVFLLIERVYPFIFYWHFGYPWLWASFPGVQLSDWIGFFGLNLISLIINSLILLFVVHRKKGEWMNRYLGYSILLFIAINGLGALNLRQIPPADQKMKILVVQGNIGNLEKIQAEAGGTYKQQIVDTFLRLTEEKLIEKGPVDLIIWPETAFPEMFIDGRSGYHRYRLNNFLKKYNTPLLTGVYYFKVKEDKMFNSLMLLKDDQVLGGYQKTHLLAFGEYLPFGEMFPKLKAMLPMVSDFGRGGGPSILSLGDIKFGAQICYEGLFDEFSTELQNKGAQIFVNVTNDSWFGYPFEPYQHMYMTLARAIENRRPLVRVTNTGISTAILHDGKLLDFSAHNQEWADVYEIPFHSAPPKTFYVNISDKWPLILLFMIGLLILGDRIARTRKH